MMVVFIWIMTGITQCGKIKNLLSLEKYFVKTAYNLELNGESKFLKFPHCGINKSFTCSVFGSYTILDYMENYQSYSLKDMCSQIRCSLLQ